MILEEWMYVSQENRLSHVTLYTYYSLRVYIIKVTFSHMMPIQHREIVDCRILRTSKHHVSRCLLEICAVWVQRNNDEDILRRRFCRNHLIYMPLDLLTPYSRRM